MRRKELRLLRSVSDPLTVMIQNEMRINARRTSVEGLEDLIQLLVLSRVTKSTPVGASLSLHVALQSSSKIPIGNPIRHGKLRARQTEISPLLSQKPRTMRVPPRGIIFRANGHLSRVGLAKRTIFSMQRARRNIVRRLEK